MVNRMDTADMDYVRQRADADEMAYLIKAMDPAVAPKLAPAMHAIRASLEGERGGREWASVVATGLRSSEVTVKTLDNLIRKMIKHGFLIKEGEYQREYRRGRRGFTVTDMRRLTLGDWPTR